MTGWQAANDLDVINEGALVAGLVGGLQGDRMTPGGNSELGRGDSLEGLGTRRVRSTAMPSTLT